MVTGAVEPAERSVADIAALTPRLADGVRFWPLSPTPRGRYRAESGGRFHELGHAEYAVLSLLDGETTVAEAVSLCARQLREDALTLGEVAELLRWAAGAELLRLPKEAVKPSPLKAVAAVNPMWLSVPLPSPQPLVDAVRPLLGWTQSPRFLLLILLPLAAVAAGTARLHAGEIADAFGDVLAVTNWLPLLLVWAGLKVWHELGHALACRRYGVEVPKCGVIFILLAPCPFVDATASWRLRSRWPRIHVALAGMIAEALVAVLVLLAWPLVDSPAVHQAMANTLMAATVTTVLFNANPLMRFDGYYVLSDLCESPNLAGRGGAAVRDRVTRLLTGVRPRSPEPAAVEAYGWAALAWRVLITVSLVAGAEALWPGVGLAVGVLGAAATLLPSLVRSAGHVLKTAGTPLLRIRAAAVFACLAAAAFGLSTATWPFGVQVPAVVTAGEDADVRAGAAGFVQAVSVTDGDLVSAGDVVATLRNEDLRVERSMLQAELRRSLAADRARSASDEFLEAQIEADARRTIRRRLALLDERIASLSVRSEAAGRVTTPPGLVGRHVEEGDPVAFVIGGGPAEVTAFVADRLVEHFAGREGAAVTLHLPDGRTAAGVLERVEPTASRDAVDASLTPAAGGPVVARETDDGPEAALPHFTMTVRCGEPLPVGLRVAVAFASERPVHEHVARRLLDWWRSMLPQG